MDNQSVDAEVGVHLVAGGLLALFVLSFLLGEATVACAARLVAFADEPPQLQPGEFLGGEFGGLLERQPRLAVEPRIESRL